MNESLKTILLIPLTFFAVSCSGPTEPSIPYKEGATVLSVDGMHCSNCEGTIMTSLSKIEGLEWARAENEISEVAYTGSVSKDVVVAAIEEAGFKVAQ